MRLMHKNLKSNRSVMNFKYSSSFLVIFLLLLSCKNQPSEIKSVSSSSYFESLSGRIVNSMDSVLDVKGDKFVFIFNSFDCESCVDAGIKLVKNIDAYDNQNGVCVIATMENPSNVQYRNKYYDYIYCDEKDLIRRELKFVPTPIVLLLDKSNVVKYAFMPRDTIDIAKYTEELIAKMKHL